MALPSTFPEVHEGSSNTFQRHRLDYLAIPMDWMKCAQRSAVAIDFDMLHSKDDHKPLTLDLSFVVPKFAQRKQPTYDKSRASEPANAHIVRQLFEDFTTPPWECSVDEHSRELTNYIHQGLCKAFPCNEKRRVVKQPYISGYLWDLVLERKNLRNEIQHMKKMVKESFLRRTWNTWKGDGERLDEMKQAEKLAVRYRVFLEEILEGSNQRIAKMIKRDKQQCLQKTLNDLEEAFKMRDNKKIFEALKPFQNQNSRRKLKTPRPLPLLIGDHGVVENQKEWQEAWETYWADIEGATIKPWIEHQRMFCNHKVTFESSKDDILSAVPTLLNVEHAVMGIKRGKAGGIDGIMPDVVRAAGSAAARCIFTLATKEIVRGQVPLIDRGGISLPLYKHKGAQSARSSFRSIVLENCFGKTISRLWRPELERGFKALAGSQQGGAKKGMGPITHILKARVLQRRAFIRGESFGWILLDTESAFYKAVRQLLVRNDGFEATDEFCAYFSKALGIGPEEHRWFYEHLTAETMLQKAEANKAVQKWVLSSMEGSWCKLRSSPNCLATSLNRETLQQMFCTASS